MLIDNVWPQITCLEYTIPAAGCSRVNTTRQCASTELIATTSNCMLANCSLVETLGEYLHYNINLEESGDLITLQDSLRSSDRLRPAL